jgi:hypothetical protein
MACADLARGTGRGINERELSRNPTCLGGSELAEPAMRRKGKVGCADAVPTTEYVNTQGKVRAVCGESRTHGSREGGTGDPARDDRPLLYTILGLINERGKKGLPLERVYKLLFSRDLYLMAYGKIYRNKGAMTHGVTEETPDGMSLAKIDAIIEALRYERYQWLPARRTYIPKKNGKKRPLGMPVWSEKLVQEVIRLILEAYFEPQVRHDRRYSIPNRVGRH